MNETLYLKLETSDHCIVTRPRRDDDEWDRDDTYTEWTIHGVRFVSENDGYDFVTRQKQNHYFVVLEFYNTGDSFGRDENRMCEQYLAPTREAAETIAQALRDFVANAPDWTYSVELKDPITGEPMTFHVNCLGYFDSLNDFEVVEVDVLTQPVHRWRY